MPSILNMEDCEKHLWPSIQFASSSTKTVSLAEINPQKRITEEGGQGLCSTLRHGSRFVANAIGSFIKTRQWPSKWDIYTIPYQSDRCQNYQNMQPIKFKIAGAQAEATEGKLQVSFHPIPLPLWNAIIGFHRQVSINYMAESVTYHRWCEAQKTYHTLIPYQKTSRHGLHVTTNWKDERNVAMLDEYAAKFGEEFMPACTIHTHVDINAFESGTDARDEEEAPGWHITLGHLISRSKYDTHFRMRVPKTKSLKKLINVDRAYPLDWDNLFLDGEDTESWIHTTPGTTDFFKFLDRIDAS